MKETVKIKVSGVFLDWVKEKLSLENAEIEYQDQTVQTLTAHFSNGFEADIKLCAGQTNYFLDPVLFNERGGEVGLLDPSLDDMEGVFEFEVDDDVYIVEVVREDTPEEEVEKC